MLTQTSLFRDQAFCELDACCALKTVADLDMETAQKLLKRFGGIQKVAQASEAMLAQVPGIGVKKAAKIKAMTHWALLLQEAEIGETTIIRSPADIANLQMLEMSLLEREEMRVILLNTKNRVLLVETVYQGSLNTTVLRVSEVFRAAIINNAAGIVLLHNHPSGDPTPSPEDVHVTEMIYEIGRGLNIAVLDHVIFGGNRYVSLKERGLAFKA